MTELENVPAQMRAVAETIEKALGDPNGSRDVLLGIALATLRTAAAAWPGGLARRGMPAGAPERLYEAGRLVGFEQGIAQAEEYAAAAEQDERDAAKHTGEPPPGERETVQVANVAGVVAGHWRQRRGNPQVDHELIGSTLASLLDALLAQVDHALDATAPRD